MCMEAVNYARTSVGAAGGLRPWVAARSVAPLTQRLGLVSAALHSVGKPAPGART